jgi:hypothetical protein
VALPTDQPLPVAAIKGRWRFAGSAICNVRIQPTADGFRVDINGLTFYHHIVPGSGSGTGWLTRMTGDAQGDFTVQLDGKTRLNMTKHGDKAEFWTRCQR